MIERLVEDLLGDAKLGARVVHHRRLPAQPPVHAEPRQPLPSELVHALRARGIERLFSHQAAAIDAVRAGRHVLSVTPTASGKTLTFGAPVLERFLCDPDAKALFLYPTKALAQDQVAGFTALAAGLGVFRLPKFEIYDGDTPAAKRKQIRGDPPQVLVTNPDMLHLGILAHHQDWEALLRDLRFVVLDELHVYRGIFGAHVHHVLRRLRRLCARLGARPQFIAASATVGNPADFAEQLVGESFEVVDRSGAPGGARDVLFLNPAAVSPYTVATRVVARAAKAGKRTIAFTKARRITELLYTWLVRQEPELADCVAPYRAGYLPSERRRLEARLFHGDLRAVLTTSALELGIDVGGLDVCVLVGYPGSLMSAWQRIGRVGRAGRDALAVLIAMPDALDQYIVHHPERFFGKQFEHAVLDAWNPEVAGTHLVCAAAEQPLHTEELGDAEARSRLLVDRMTREGRLTQDAEGRRWFSFRRRPQRDARLRSSGQPFDIVEQRSGRSLGQIDGTRVYYECHPGAIYLHGGRTWHVLHLDEDERKVLAERARVDWYTVVLGEKETEILETLDRDELEGDGHAFPVGYGRLKVTVRIREYQKKRLHGGEPISTHPLELPPLIFETTGFWIELPLGMNAAFTADGQHFMGSIHATEHAMIGLFPLLAIADRGDVGGISYTAHPQLRAPAIFVYDGVPGGAGLAQRGFRDVAQLLERTLELVDGCACEDGCPSCIQSPKCGNGNKPLDKAGAVRVMRLLRGSEPVERAMLEAPAEPVWPPAPPARKHGVRGDVHGRAEANGTRIVVFDLETQRGADEVGGWNHPDRMGLALAVVWDARRQTFRTYHESDVDRLLLDLVMADCVVGYNLDRFDLPVLAGYTEWDLGRIRTCDMMELIREKIGYRLSLNHLAEVNLGQSKAANGLQSLCWWKEGRIDLIERYCRQDVEVTRRLFELGRRQGYLLYRDREDRTLRVPVGW